MGKAVVSGLPGALALPRRACAGAEADWPLVRSARQIPTPLNFADTDFITASIKQRSARESRAISEGESRSNIIGLLSARIVVDATWQIVRPSNLNCGGLGRLVAQSGNQGAGIVGINLSIM
jgi:hypothetical protein